MLPNEGYARVTIEYSGVPIPRGAATVFAVRDELEGGLVGPERGALIAETWGEVVMPELDDGIVAVQAVIKVGPDETGVTFEVPINVEGGSPGQAAPPNVCFLALKASTLGGRRGKGKMYLPGVNEDQVTEAGIIDGSKVDSLQTALESFRTTLEEDPSVPTIMVLEHFDSTHWVLVGGQPRRVPDEGTAPPPSDITGFTVSNTVATQRRRLRG